MKHIDPDGIRDRIAARLAGKMTIEERRKINHARAVAALKHPSMISRWAARSVPADADVDARLAEVPEDTRSVSGHILGDPLPGRSALDRERGQ